MHTVIGIDPGIVHTGVVVYKFRPLSLEISISYGVYEGVDADYIANGLSASPKVGDLSTVFIEGYRPRSHFSTDARMVEAVSELRKAFPGSKVLDNTGVKKIVTPSLIRLLRSDKWRIATHHDDLTSAARIAVLGMMKDPELNKVLADFVRDSIHNSPWDITKGLI